MGVKIKNDSSSNKSELRQLFAKIKDISPSGKVKIEFSEKVISSDKDMYPKVDEALQVTGMVFDLIDGYSIPIELESHCLSLENSEMEL